MNEFKEGDRVEALIPMRSGSYWASGRLSNVATPQGSRLVFNGYDRGGFPISIGVTTDQLRKVA